MLERLYRDVLIRGYESGLRRRRTFRYWDELERSQWRSRPEIETAQFASLGRLLRHAESRCPYYRDAWRGAGLSSSSLKDLQAFARWPVIDRETVRTHRMGMRATGLKLIAKTTGGSSGVPLQFDLDPDSNERRTAAWHRAYAWAGAAPGTKQLHLWGTPLGPVHWGKRLKSRLHDRLYRHLMLSSFQLGEATVADFLARLNYFRPDVIVAYTNPLYAFARLLSERGFAPHRARSIVVGAERLYDFQRRLIEDVFRAPVFETYGSREFMLIGAECDRHRGLHLTMEHLLVEVLDDDGKPTPPGDEGNVVITDLYNYGMPFIRYANGDRAEAGWGTCLCGRGLPTLKRVTGRKLDVLLTPDGRRVAGELFPHLLKDHAGVRQFQVLQEVLEAVTLRLVISKATPPDLAAIEHAVRGVLGPTVRVAVDVVDEIPLSRSGKQQVVRSEVARAAMGPPGEANCDSSS